MAGKSGKTFQKAGKLEERVPTSTVIFIKMMKEKEENLPGWPNSGSDTRRQEAPN